MCFLQKPGIYKITNPKGKIYIGRSINVKKRFYEHKHKTNTLISRSIQKYGYENHLFEVLIYLYEKDNDLLNRLEIYYINKYNSTNRNIGLNLSSGGGRLNFNHTEKTIEKMKKNRKGRQNSLGRILNQETKDKISESLKGNKISLNQIEKQKNTLLDKKISHLYLDIETGIFYDSQRDLSKYLDINRSKIRKNNRFLNLI